MAAERAESAKERGPEKAPEQGAPAAAAAPGGFKAWLPLILNITLMPALAYLTTAMVLLPKLKSGQAASAHEQSSAPADAHGADGKGGGASGRGKFTVPLSGKVLVNIAGTMGTRYLLANVTLVGTQPTLRELVDKNDAELRDVAAGVLASKTIADLEKPGARNLIRTELTSVFNTVLGEGAVTELFLTEFAIQ